MDKELKEKKDKLLDDLDNLIKDTETKCKEALNMPCKIHIDNDGKGIKLAAKGGRLSLLITLAGAEKNILKELKCSTEEFNLIKIIVKTAEAGDNE